MTGVAAALASIETLDVASLAGVELAGAVERAQRVRAWLDAFDARVAWRSAQLAGAGSGAPAAEVLADAGRRRAREAAAAAARSELCARMPALHEALEQGLVSAGHVDAVVSAAGGLSAPAVTALVELAPTLVAAARCETVERFERDCRDLARLVAGDEGESRQEALRRRRRVRRWVDAASGMSKTLLELDPETDAKVAAALHAATRAARASLLDPAVDWDHLQADALVGLITGSASLDRRVPEVSVVVDLETLRGGLHDHSVCETSDGTALAPETVRRLACDADIVPVVLGGAGEVLDQGRARRLATAAQRRAIAAMHRSCVMPGCSVDVDACRIHHVDPWQLGGRTDLDRLVPVCEPHHHRLHEGHWRLTITSPQRTITLTRPDGTTVYDGPGIDRTHGPPSRAPAVA